MMPYSKINVGDIFASPLKLTDSKLEYLVVGKSEGLIELESSHKHPAFPKTFWVSPSNAIFKVRLFNNKNAWIPEVELILYKLIGEAQERFPIGSSIPREEILSWLETRTIHWNREEY